MNCLQVAGNLRRGTPQPMGAKTTLEKAPSTLIPWTTQECAADTWQTSRGKLCDSSERRQ